MKTVKPALDPTCRYAVSGSGPASAPRKNWTLTGSNAEIGPKFPYLQICSVGSPELCTAGPPGCLSSHLQDQGKKNRGKWSTVSQPALAYIEG